jgi:Rhodopirellula transposase DDE domain
LDQQLPADDTSELVDEASADELASLRGKPAPAWRSDGVVQRGGYCRLAGHITQTWRGTPLTSRLAVVDLIASTTTKTGLIVRCELDRRIYPKGIKVSDDEMASINIKGDAFHPEWNYTISPRVPP